MGLCGSQLTVDIFRWNASHRYIISAGFHRSTVENFVRNSKIVLRYCIWVTVNG